ncbi:MAG: hypothetical protein Q7T59_04950 [Candidatus Woesebacteria bacterium]|nr:hypothetical protein [Candidatus Woesebacteria bacterium]
MALYKKIKFGPEFERLPLKKLFVYSFVINLITILLGLLAKLILPPEIPLFYGLPQTSEQLAKSIFIILPATIALLLTLVNAILSINIGGTYLKKTLAFTSIAISLLALIGTFKIIFLVGSI